MAKWAPAGSVIPTAFMGPVSPPPPPPPPPQPPSPAAQPVTATGNAVFLPPPKKGFPLWLGLVLGFGGCLFLCVILSVIAGVTGSGSKPPANSGGSQRMSYTQLHIHGSAGTDEFQSVLRKRLGPEMYGKAQKAQLTAPNEVGAFRVRITNTGTTTAQFDLSKLRVVLGDKSYFINMFEMPECLQSASLSPGQSIEGLVPFAIPRTDLQQAQAANRKMFLHYGDPNMEVTYSYPH